MGSPTLTPSLQSLLQMRLSLRPWGLSCSTTRPKGLSLLPAFGGMAGLIGGGPKPITIAMGLRPSSSTRPAIRTAAPAYRTLTLSSRLTQTPRPFQRDAIEAWVNTGRRGTVILPTGAGKSYVGQRAWNCPAKYPGCCPNDRSHESVVRPAVCGFLVKRSGLLAADTMKSKTSR